MGDSLNTNRRFWGLWPFIKGLLIFMAISQIVIFAIEFYSGKGFIYRFVFPKNYWSGEVKRAEHSIEFNSRLIQDSDIEIRKIVTTARYNDLEIENFLDLIKATGKDRTNLKKAMKENQIAVYHKEILIKDYLQKENVRLEEELINARNQLAKCE